MTKVRISRGKFRHLQVCASEHGIIAAVAMDQRSSLQRSFEKVSGKALPTEDLTEFKCAVTKILSRYASAVLLDPEYGVPAIRERAAGSGVLLSYEMTGYDPAEKGRLPALLPRWSVRRLVEAGTDAVKVLLYFNPFDDERINTVKLAFIERVGDECAAQDIPFFLEPLAYDDRYEVQSLEFARLKPKYVTAMMEEFSKPRYGVDVLKVEIPINAAYLSGSGAYKGGECAYDRQEALEHMRMAAVVAKKPFLYLSGGVDDAVFRENLELAAEAGVLFSGVLCGRATWKDGIPIFIREGTEALEAWLLDRGVANIRALNEVVGKAARPWYTIYGGLENIEVVG